ncbi:MAG: PE family protein [Mycobacterium sp.]
MSLLSVVPDIVVAASANLEDVGSALRSANAAAATQTTAIAAPAADEVSAAITALFGTHAQEFQALSARAAGFHEDFVATLNAGVGQYINAEAANVQQTLVSAVNTPAQLLLGHPLIGTGSGAAAASPAQTVNTRIGSISISTTVTGSLLSPGTDGLFAQTATLSTPLGNALVSVNGTASGSGTAYQLQVTGGNLILPRAVPLLAGLVGPYVTGTASLANSANAFLTAVHGGNVLGAARAFFSAPFKFTDAVLFGHQTITVPFGGNPNPSVDLNIPFGGIFASTEPLSATWPQYSVNESGFTETLVGGQLSFTGTEFGGIVPAFLNAIGVRL